MTTPFSIAPGLDCWIAGALCRIKYRTACSHHRPLILWSEPWIGMVRIVFIFNGNLSAGELEQVRNNSEYRENTKEMLLSAPRTRTSSIAALS